MSFYDTADEQKYDRQPIEASAFHFFNVPQRGEKLKQVTGFYFWDPVIVVSKPQSSICVLSSGAAYFWADTKNYESFLGSMGRAGNLRSNCILSSSIVLSTQLAVQLAKSMQNYDGQRTVHFEPFCVSPV